MNFESWKEANACRDQLYLDWPATSYELVVRRNQKNDVQGYGIHVYEYGQYLTRYTAGLQLEM